MNFQMFKLDLEKSEGPANICWIIKKAREFQKNICFIDFAKTFDCVDHNKLWKILNDVRSPQVKKQQLELGMEQQTGSKLRRNTSSLYIVTLFI